VVHTPGLARLRLQFDHRAERLRLALDVAAPVTRCLATHANPLSGIRDVAMMPKLRELFPAERPTFAVLMTSERGGTIRIGDEVAQAAR
jgi:uncharacterized protein YcbX